MTTTYTCEACGAQYSIESGPMGGGGTPQGWFQLSGGPGGGAGYGPLWFDKWACVATYAGEKSA